MAKPKIRTPFNRGLHLKDRETNKFPSLTVPEQTMTLRTILTRHASGLPMDAPPVKFFEYDDESDPENTDLPHDFKHWDLADQQAYKEQVNLKIQHLQTLTASQAAAAKEKREARKKLKEQKQQPAADEKPKPATPQTESDK